jgi:zona occludens toxin (predicted ATPase)
MKQEVKKSMFSPYKILLALAVFFMLVMVSYKVYNEFIVTPTES